MVNIATWNIRGAGTQIKQVEVQNLLSDNQLGVLGLLETRVKFENQEKVLRGICDWKIQSNYSNAYNGRIWVL